MFPLSFSSSLPLFRVTFELELKLANGHFDQSEEMGTSICFDLRKTGLVLVLSWFVCERTANTKCAMVIELGIKAPVRL